MAVRTLIGEVAEPGLREFVRGEIAGGCTALSETVSKRIDLTLGRFFLIMPQNFVPSTVEAGGWNWTPRNLNEERANDILVEVIADYLKASGTRFVIQDYMMRRTDPCFTDDPLRMFYNEELYWELHGLGITGEKIKDCCGDASYWPWIGYFCKVREGKVRFISAKDLEDVADNLVGLAAQALHDSYVFWWRTDREQFPGRTDD